MSAYAIAELSMRDASRFHEFDTGIRALIARHGGEILVRTGDAEALAGSWTPRLLVVVRYPDLAAIRSFVADPDYVALMETSGHAACAMNLVAADGLTPA